MGSLIFKIVFFSVVVQILCQQELYSEELISKSSSSEIPSASEVENVPLSDTIISEDAIKLISIVDTEQMNDDSEQTLEGEVVPGDIQVGEIPVGAVDILNSSSTNSSNSTDISDEKGNATSIVACNSGKENGGQPVELVNSTRLISILITETNVTDRRTNADCTLVLFYARYCPFSSMAAPHFNALPRAFPDIKLAAVDAMKYHSFNTQYGIVGVPTVMLFHNGRPAAKFNESEYNLEAFAKFITKYTGLQPHEKLYVTSADFGGPVSSVPTKETDYCLIVSWAFMFVCGLYFFSKSSWWRWISEAVQNTWREAEAQHEHGD